MATSASPLVNAPIDGYDWKYTTFGPYGVASFAGPIAIALPFRASEPVHIAEVKYTVGTVCSVPCLGRYCHQCGPGHCRRRQQHSRLSRRQLDYRERANRGNARLQEPSGRQRRSGGIVSDDRGHDCGRYGPGGRLHHHQVAKRTVGGSRLPVIKIVGVCGGAGVYNTLAPFVFQSPPDGLLPPQVEEGSSQRGNTHHAHVPEWHLRAGHDL